APGGRAATDPARGDPGPRQRPAPAEHAHEARHRPGGPLRDRRGRALARRRLVKKGLSQPVVIVLIVVGFLVFAAGGYFVVLGPQRSKAADIDKQIADTNSSIDAARALTLQAKAGAKIRVADLYRLTKAMPDQVDMAGIILELNQVAQDSGITFENISPSTTGTPISGYLAIPITVE